MKNITTNFISPVFMTNQYKQEPGPVDETRKINGQPSLFLLDLKGKEHSAIAEVNRKKRVNGQREISLSFLYDEINAYFIHDIEFGWKILFKGEWYTITGPSYVLDGDLFSVGVDAVLSFFVDMNGHYLQDEVEDKSQTPADFFRMLFEGTGYSYVLVDNLLANTFNYQANESKTERFLYAIDRFKGEYVIRGKTAYIHGLVGSDKDVILHEDLNIQDVSIEVDASGFHTWAKGFGDKDEEAEGDGDYKLEVEYVSPLVDKYDYIEGPAIRDGSYKHEDALTEAVKNQVENSAQISTTITAVDLTNNGYPEMQFEEGDRVWLYVTQLKQNQQVRVVEIDETFDWEGNIVAVQYTVGNEGIAARYKTQQYDTLKDFRDIASGRKTLEYNWLPEAIKRASDIINGNIDSRFRYGAGEIIGINESNQNGYMRFNTDGIGFSRDGGKTYRSAMTYEGIVADAITAGTLRGILIEGVDIIGSRIMSPGKSGYFTVSGSDAEFHNTTNGRRLTISPSGFYGYNSGGDIRFQADSTLVTSSAIGTSNWNVYLAADSGKEARVVDITGVPSDGNIGDYSYLPLRASGIYANFLDNNSGVSGPNVYVRPRSGGALRVTASGTTDVYYDIHAARHYGTGFITTSTNAYIGADGELRVVNKGMGSVYRDVRAASYYGTQLSLSANSNATHMHIRPANDGEVRMTGRTSTDNYRPVRAQRYLLPDGKEAFAVGTFSLLAMHPTDNEGTDLVNDIDLLRHTDNGKPVYKINGHDIAIDDVVATLVKSNQETTERLKTLEAM